MSDDPRSTNGNGNGNGSRLRFSLNVLAWVMMAGGGLVASYYRGQIDTLKDQHALDARMAIIETKEDGARERQLEIIRRLDRVEDRFEQVVEAVRPSLPARRTAPTFQRGQQFDK